MMVLPKALILTEYFKILTDNLGDLVIDLYQLEWRLMYPVK